MVNFNPPQVFPNSTCVGDPRIRDILGSDKTQKIAIIGFPCDQGVSINGGRIGAAEAPNRIRESFFGLTPDPINFDSFSRLITQTHDRGNLKLSGNLEDDQLTLGEVVAEELSRGTIPIIIGGGHETSYGHFLGYVAAQQNVSILNWDAHLDVRPLIDTKGHSGSSFRQAIEHSSKCLKKYIAAGLLPYSVSHEHLDFVIDSGGCVHWRDAIQENTISKIYKQLQGKTMLTFDIDAVDSCYAPGVSAPASCGMHPRIWLNAAYHAGCSANVSSFDVVETNPNYDIDNRTVKLAALTIWEFYRGLCER